VLQRIVEFSIRFRGVVIALASLTVGYGIYTITRAKLDVFPEFAPPHVEIQTEAPGLSPEQVEALVTRPIESAVNGASNLESLRSKSIQALSVVTAVFRDGTDIFTARQLISERLEATASLMPPGVRPPVMAPLTSSTGTVLEVGLTSTKRSLMELRTLADWTIRQRLLGVPGVSKVVIYGGEVRQIQVQGKPERLLSYGLMIQDLVAAARESTGIRGSGFVENENQRVVLQTEGQSLTPEELGQAVFGYRDGASVRLKDVARVVDGPEPMAGAALIQGQPGVVLIVSSQYGANTMEVGQAAERALQELRPTFDAEGITFHPALFRATDFINTAIHNITTSLWIGGILVAAVLFLFLFNVRTASISIAAIPLSLLIAIIILERFGVTLNTLTLGGLAIAIGEVVDDAIIDVENIFRRLRENRASSNPRSAFRVVRDASIEVRSAVIYATFVVALVFLPVVTMSGVQGRLFAPLGAAYVLAILASLAVALTLTPALSFVLLRKSRQVSDPPLMRILTARYRTLLEAVMQRSKLVIVVVVFLIAGAAVALDFFSTTFLPSFQENNLIIHTTAIPGTSLEESLRTGRLISEKLLANPRVRTVAQKAGRAENSAETRSTNASEIDINLRPSPGGKARSIRKEIREELSKFSGLSFEVNSFLAERIDETISGLTAQVVVEIFGEDLDVLDRKAREVARVLSGTPGAVDVQMQSPPGTPEMLVRLRPERLRQFGFRPVEVLDVIRTAYQGLIVAETYQGTRAFSVAVILDPALRRSPETLGALMLHNEAGTRVPLRELTEIYPSAGRSTIVHQGGRRVQTVTCNVSGRALSSFVSDARARIAKRVVFPAGVYPVFTGAAQARAQAQHEILLYSAIAAVGIVLLLLIAFRRARNLLLMLANLPFALVGGVLAVIFFMGGVLSLGALVGFVSLFGITTRNSIMLISHYDHLVTDEGMTWGMESALRGASERLMPILMTALVTGLGLLPLAIGSGQAGREIDGPMAIVILGGLVTSTALNLVVLPVLALRYGRFAEPGTELTVQAD
jgi:CzcA family heavy metal efflux pump